MMWIEDERGHHVLEGLPAMPLDREKDAQRLGLQTIRWKEVRREIRHGRALRQSGDQRKRGARHTERARDSTNREGARDTKRGARDAKKSRDIQLFTVRLSTPQLERTKSDTLEVEMRRLYPETFEPPMEVPKRRPHDLPICLRDGAKPFHNTPYRVMPLEDEEMQRQ
jgi:hypothetical protein